MSKPDSINKLLVIAGPTASGKSGLALRLARGLAQGKPKKTAEIISADSRQVYRGMDIGTGKILKDKTLPVNSKFQNLNSKFYSSGIPHYLIDVVSPKTKFNVAKFKKLARKKIEEIVSRGHLPIIVGGTGFWIDALIYDWPIPEVKEDKKLRAQLEKQTAKQLFARLKKLDSERAKTIQPENKRRLIRALEIILSTRQKIPRFHFYGDRSKNAIYKLEDRKLRRLQSESRLPTSGLKIISIGLNPPQKELDQKIYKRLITRLKQGMVKEVKKLHSSGVSWKRLDDFGLEYRWISRYLRNKVTRQEMIEKLYRDIKKYARRQMAWFKRNKNIRWFSDTKKAEKYIMRQF